MKRQMGATEFKAKCLGVLEDVYTRRDEVIITKRGKPYARIVPIEQGNDDVFGRMAGTLEILGDIVGPTGVKWEAQK